MTQRLAIGLGLVLAIAAGAGVLAIANSITNKVTSMSAASATATNLSGDWQLDPSQSDRFGGGDGPRGRRGPRPEWRRDKDGEGGEGRIGEGRRGRFGGRGIRGGRGMRAGFLPRVLHIEQSAATVRLADSTGTTLRVIATRKGEGGEEALNGEWKNGQLVVERQGPRDMKITETFALEDGGRTLVVRTERQREDSDRSRGMRRVYRKVGV